MSCGNVNSSIARDKPKRKLLKTKDEATDETSIETENKKPRREELTCEHSLAKCSHTAMPKTPSFPIPRCCRSVVYIDNRSIHAGSAPRAHTPTPSPLANCKCASYRATSSTANPVFAPHNIACARTVTCDAAPTRFLRTMIPMRPAVLLAYQCREERTAAE